MLNLTTENPKFEVYVKNEGYADFRFISDRAKVIAHELQIPNSLAEFETFCGQPVWSPESPEGLYKCGFKMGAARRLIRELRSRGLTVETEI
jgi:hypothetical protein